MYISAHVLHEMLISWKCAKMLIVICLHLKEALIKFTDGRVNNHSNVWYKNFKTHYYHHRSGMYMYMYSVLSMSISHLGELGELTWDKRAFLPNTSSSEG